MAARRTPDAPIQADRPVTRARTRRKSPAVAAMQVDPKLRNAMIAESAYLRAERRGFAPGRETEDWLAAEVEVDALLRAGATGRSQ
ncbi:MAG: DUF2934 domain-containing protein [Proteobacteria bacterium]|nr:DUF2934 domain-containing protein [Pseudomonadota bacterium]